MHPFLENLKTKKATVVLAEAEDERVIRAAGIIAKKGLADLILLGDETKITSLKKKYKVSFDFPIINPATYETDFSEKIFTIRKGKATKAQAKKLAKDNHYFAAMLVREGIADAAVSGNLTPTAQTLRAGIHILGVKRGVKAFSYFMMLHPDQELPIFFADCAFNINPEPKLLAEIAQMTAQEAKLFGVKPRVAMLSYSTHGSGGGERADAMRKATALAKRRKILAEELQFDAAFDSQVGKLKAPESKVAGKANVFVFPSLMAANIGYKIAERLGGFHAVGPMIWGLKKPMNDLSRGCSADDIVSLVHLTTQQVR